MASPHAIAIKAKQQQALDWLEAFLITQSTKARKYALMLG
jgi:hypothetical protein